MRTLSGLDAGFLYVETPETPMHVGSLTIYELPADLVDNPNPLSAFAQRAALHFETRLMLAPLLHQRLALMPFDLGHPVWVDASDVDLSHHVRSHQLKAKRGASKMVALEDFVAQLHSEPLDRDKPLWQFHIIAGFAEGKIAVYSKVHHAALDGAAGVALANAILDLTPEGRVVDAGKLSGKRTSARAVPSKSKLIGSLFSNTLAQYAKIVRALPAAVRKVASIATESRPEGIRSAISNAVSAGKALLAPKTPFNTQITQNRSFRSLSLSLKELKAIAAALDASLNDVVLTLCSGALRSYLLAQKGLPTRSLIAAVPISLRDSGDLRQNNQVTMLPASLGTDGKTPEQRLAKVRSAMDALKKTTADFKSIIPTDFPSLGAPWLVSGLAQIYGRTKIADRISLPVNLVISNVAGPRVPLYLAGAKMVEYFPVSIIVHGLALNITVHSYLDRLDFGLVACPDAVPNLSELVDYLVSEQDLLKRLAAKALLSGIRPVKASVKPVASSKLRPRKAISAD